MDIHDIAAATLLALVLGLVLGMCAAPQPAVQTLNCYTLSGDTVSIQGYSIHVDRGTWRYTDPETHVQHETNMACIF